MLQATEQSLKLRIEGEVRGAFRNLQTAERAATLLEEVIPSADTLLQLLNEAYAGGRVPVDSYLASRSRVVAMRSEFLNAYQDYAEAKREFERAVGLDLQLVR